MSWRVIVGTLSLVITMILLGYVAVTEQDRMANFGIAYTAREIEAGRTLFESNCSPFHELDWTVGSPPGRAPRGGTSRGPNWQPDTDHNSQGVGTRAPLRIKAADYKGKATSGDQSLFESIVSPDASIVPGNAAYAAAGVAI